MIKILNKLRVIRGRALACLVLTAAAAAMGQTVPVSISSSVDKSSITIGDVIEYTVIVTYDDTMDVKPPDAGSHLGSFEIRDYTIDDLEEAGGRVVMKARYMVSTFTTGDYYIPPVTVYYKSAQDTMFSHMATDPIKIKVESMNPRTDGDIRDLKPPVEVPLTVWEKIRIPVYIAGLLLVLSAAYFIYRLKKQGRSLLPGKKEPEKPAHETAFKLLEDLKDRDLVSKGMIKEFHVELSDIFRRYISARYFIPAPEMTTRQLIDTLVSECTVESGMKSVEEILHQCDMAKFAKHIPAGSECIAALDQAWEFVEETKIVIFIEESDSGADPETAESSEPSEQLNQTDET